MQSNVGHRRDAPGADASLADLHDVVPRYAILYDDAWFAGCGVAFKAYVAMRQGTPAIDMTGVPPVEEPSP